MAEKYFAVPLDAPTLAAPYQLQILRIGTACRARAETPGSVSAKRPTEIGRHHLLDRFRLNVELPQTRQGPARHVVRLERALPLSTEGDG
jgi:hypothetical protein